MNMMFTPPHRLGARQSSPLGMGRHRGATLIEVLVSVLVIAFGILAMASLQSNALKFQKTTEYRAVATLLASDIADRMRANLPGATDGNYTWNATQSDYAALTSSTAPEPNPTCGTGGAANGTPVPDCTSSQMAERDLAEWKLRLFRSLPQSTGMIGTVTNNTLNVWVVWQDPDNKDSSNNQSPQGAECPQDWAEATSISCVSVKVAL
jgi:type IV pilus assembly protein PilV